MKKTFLSFACLVLAISLAAAACASMENPAASKVIKSAPAGNLTATLSNETGRLKVGEQDILLSFTDSAGKGVETSAASLNFYMPAMGSMGVMNDGAVLTTTRTPGVFKGKVKIETAGEWQTQISYEGAAGSGKTSIPVTAY